MTSRAHNPDTQIRRIFALFSTRGLRNNGRAHRVCAETSWNTLRIAMTLKKIEKKSLADEVFEQLREEIVSGRMAPGDALPAERGLSETLGVNRGAVREALKRLEQARLSSIHQGGATRVLDYRETAGTDLLTALLLRADGTVDTRVARSVLEMRRALALDISRLAARRATPEHIDSMRAVHAEMIAARRDLEALQDLSMTLWGHIVGASDNVAYQLAYNSLRESYDVFKRVLLPAMAAEITDMEGYAELIDALEDADEGSAEALAAKLVDASGRHIQHALDALTP